MARKNRYFSWAMISPPWDEKKAFKWKPTNVIKLERSREISCWMIPNHYISEISFWNGWTSGATKNSPLKNFQSFIEFEVISKKSKSTSQLGGGFNYCVFCISTRTCGNDPILLICFKSVETTQLVNTFYLEVSRYTYTHRIHGTGIFTYMKTIEINQT